MFVNIEVVVKVVRLVRYVRVSEEKLLERVLCLGIGHQVIGTGFGFYDDGG